MQFQSLDELTTDAVPPNIALNRDMDLEAPYSEIFFVDFVMLFLTRTVCRRGRCAEEDRGDRPEEQHLEVVHRHGVLQHLHSPHHSQEHARKPRLVRFPDLTFLASAQEFNF